MDLRKTHEGTDLTHLLELFEALPGPEKAEALRKLQSGVGPKSPNIEKSEVHSCGLCKVYGLSSSFATQDQALDRARADMPSFDRHLQFPYVSNLRYLSTDALLQGLWKTL